MPKNKKNRRAAATEPRFFLESRLVRLRPYEEADAEVLYRFWNDPEVTRFLFTGQRPTTREGVREVMAAETKDSRHTIFMAIDPAQGVPIGIVGLYNIHGTALKAEMRIIIGDKRYWGKGYGTEIVELITYYGFDRLNLHRIYLGFTADNKGAARAYEKAGYKVEGVSREDIYRNSRYYDSVHMGLLREEYYRVRYPAHKERFSL